jgi:hypothetical protein
MARTYELDHGELPDSLDVLVPDYIDEVPKDMLDGRPMHYSREKKIIYSVGEDLVDQGGSTNGALSRWDAEDAVFSVDFK